MAQLGRSNKRINQLISEAKKKGQMAYRLKGDGAFDVVTIDTLDRKVNFIKVRARAGSTFRLDSEEQVFPSFMVVRKTVKWEGMVK